MSSHGRHSILSRNNQITSHTLRSEDNNPSCHSASHAGESPEPGHPVVVFLRGMSYHRDRTDGCLFFPLDWLRVNPCHIVVGKLLSQHVSGPSPLLRPLDDINTCPTSQRKWVHSVEHFYVSGGAVKCEFVSPCKIMP